MVNSYLVDSIFSFLLQVHGSVNGENFKSRMHAEHIELLHSPWLIELGAFYLNSTGRDGCELDGVCGHFSCDLNMTEAVMTLVLPDSIKLDYDLNCAICLVRSYFYAALGKKRKKKFYVSLNISYKCLDFDIIGFCFQSICFGLWSSLLQVMCLLSCLCDDFPRP